MIKLKYKFLAKPHQIIFLNFLGKRNIIQGENGFILAFENEYD